MALAPIRGLNSTARSRTRPPPALGRWLKVMLLASLFPALTFSFTIPSSTTGILILAAAHDGPLSKAAPNSSHRFVAAPLYADTSDRRLEEDTEDEQAKAVARFTASYGESSRKYRRTIYSHEDWLLHRSDDRLGDNLRGILFSGIVRQLQTEVTIEIAFATAVVLWNQIGAPQTHLPQVLLPTLPFTLSSPALGLLLVFRTNASYARWMEGRARWGQIISQSRNMVRMASTFCDRDDVVDSSSSGSIKIENLARHTWLLSRTIMNSLSGPEDDTPYQKALAETFSDDPRLVLRMLAAPDRASAALMDTSLTLDGLPIDEKRRVEIDKSLVIIGECLSQCERIYQQPVPLVYTRHTARFLSLWLLMLPLGLYTVMSNWILVPSVGLLSLFLFGIEELAIQLEEPFSILPMNEYCDSIRQTTMGMVQWADESAK